MFKYILSCYFLLNKKLLVKNQQLFAKGVVYCIKKLK